MRIIETLPGESNSSMISSIINLVCPQCGGSMMEFQCSGGCRRNWLAEWEWANHAIRGSNGSGAPAKSKAVSLPQRRCFAGSRRYSVFRPF